MDRRIRRLAAGLLVLFLAVFGAVNYVQVVAADRIADNPANAYRQIIAEYKVKRGTILANDAETPLAFSEKSRGILEFQRKYPQGPLYSNFTGYYSLYYGRSELEESFNEYLAGDAPELLPQTLGDFVLGRPKRGASIVTTIDPELQALAQDLVEDTGTFEEGGAIFAMDPQTGDVLLSASNPTFDPTPLASQDPKEVRRTWERLNDDRARPLRSRANDELFPPGSTFKMVTAAAALENGYTPNTLIPNPGELDLPLTDNTLQNFGGGVCPGGSQIRLADAFRISCNVSFGGIALDIGPKKLSEQTRRFGFCLDAPPSSECLSEPVPYDTAWTQGRIPEPAYFEGNDPLVAFSGIGQDEVKANPMQMALVASAIANGGVLMRPRLVTEVRDPSGQIVTQFEPEEFGTPISAQTAEDLRDMMVSVVSPLGTASAAAIPGIEVAGKTGTAQHLEGQAPHAWFVSFATDDQGRQIAVAVIVLDGGSLNDDATGGVLSAPVAKQIIEAWLAEGEGTA
jgi:penicillin-binding protein A